MEANILRAVKNYGKEKTTQKNIPFFWSIDYISLDEEQASSTRFEKKPPKN